MVSALQPREQSRVLVPSTGLGDFEASLARLNKKALAFGLDAIKVVAQATREYYWEHRDSSRGTEATLKRLDVGEQTPKGEPIWLVHELSLDYPIIKLGDWSVVGQIEATDQGNLLFSVSQDSQDVAQMQAHAFCAINCEHCNTKRSRKLGYVLKDEQGNYMEVGSTCLEDFTGIDPAAALFMQKMHLFWSEYGEDDLQASSGRISAYPTKGYLARVLFCIENSGGFVSSSKARDQGLLATYESAAFLDQDLKSDERLKNRYYETYARHSEYAQKIIDWWRQEPATDSFGHNVKLLLGQDNIDIKNKHMAFAAAAVQTYQRNVATQRHEQIVSEHVGAVGEKRDQTMVLRSVISWDSAYGVQWRINLSDEDGNRYSWRTGRPPADLLEPEAVGRNFKSKFKVKGHDEFKGMAITEVSHLKFDGWLDLGVVQENKPGVAVITVIPNTSAFVDIGLRDELASIVNAAGEQLDRELAPFIVRDTNGNEVGSVSLEEPAEDVAADGVRIWIELAPGVPVTPVAQAVAAGLLAHETGIVNEQGRVIGSVEIGADIERESEFAANDHSRALEA